MRNNNKYSVTVRKYASSRRISTGGVSFTVGRAAAPQTLCFATLFSSFFLLLPFYFTLLPTFVIFSDFLALKRWRFTLAMQNYCICRRLDIHILVFIS